MSNCVNRSSKEFKDCCKRLNVSVTTLEPIIHEFINIEGNENSFPSDVYIEERIHGKSMEVLEDTQVQLWEKEYSQPKVFEITKDAIDYYNECNKYFPKESIGLKETSDGKYEVRVAEPFSSNELEEIKQKAIANGTFMKAPNGKPSNLTERQWLHVRTKAFKRWFGDWENDSKNASKVVDENGEPLVVYHESPDKFNTFTFEKKRYDVHKEKVHWFSKENREGYGYGENIYPVFLNIRNPRITTFEEVGNLTFSELREKEDSLLRDSNSDGVIFETYDKFGAEVQYAVKTSNQIKSAEFNTGYSEKDDNIYFQRKVDYIKENQKEKIRSYYQRFDLERAERLYEKAQAIKNFYKNTQIKINTGDDIGDYDAEQKINNLLLEIKNKLNWAVDKLYAVKIDDKEGFRYEIRLTLKPKEVFEKVCINRTENYIKSLSEEAIVNEVARIEEEQSYEEDLMYHIKSKEVPLVREQLKKKNPYLSEQEVEETLDFLISLENNPETNLYVQTVLKWVKNKTIQLPRDNDTIEDLFTEARKLGLDVQSYYSPFEMVTDIIKANSEDGNIVYEKGIDPYNIPQFHYVRTTTSADGKQLDIFDVDDNMEGAQAVSQVIADTTPKTGSGKLATGIFSSPWCTARFKYKQATKKAQREEGANMMWFNRYNKGKRQIAFCEGYPVALNMSDAPKDEWWDYNDVPYNNAEDIEVSIREERLTEKIEEKSTFYDVELGDTARILYVDGKIAHIVQNHFAVAPSTYKDQKEISFANNNFFVPGFTLKNRLTTHEGVTLKYTKYRRVKLLDNDIITVNIKESDIPEFESYKKIALKHQEIESIIVNEFLSKVRLAPNSLIEEEKRLYLEANKALDLVRKAIHNKLLEKIQEETKKINKNKPTQEEKKKKVSPEVASILLENFVSYSTNKEDLNLEYSDNKNEELNTNKLDPELDYISEEELEEITNSVNKNSIIRQFFQKVIQRLLQSLKNRDLKEEYNKGLREEVNKDLENILKKILKEYHFEVLESDLKEVFGPDVLGTTDFLSKVIYLVNEGDRNALTGVEEFAHAFIKLMGSVYHKEGYRNKFSETKKYSELRDLVEQTTLYQQVYNTYKDSPNYQYENGKPNLTKIKEEAVGQALSVVLLDRYKAKTKTDKTFFEKLKEWFKDVLKWFKSHFDDGAKLDRELEKIADSILDGTYVKKYLQKLSNKEVKKLKLQDYSDTIINSVKKDGGVALGILQDVNATGGYITGSLSYRKQTPVYRKDEDSLHDIDVVYPLNVHRWHKKHPFWRSTKLVSDDKKLSNEQLIEKVKELNCIQQLLQKQPNMEILFVFPDSNGNVVVSSVVCEDKSLIKKFANLKGNYSTRLSKLSKKERDKLYIVDIFLHKGNEINKDYITDEEFNLKLTHYKHSFKAKLKYARAKDLLDFQTLDPGVNRTYLIDRTKAMQSPDLMHQILPNREDINPNETQFITESFVPSDYAKSYGLTESKLTSALNELKEIEDSYASLQSPITMSYKQYKDAVGEENTNLTNAYIELDKKAPDYNKTTKQITLPSEFYFRIAEHINKHKEFWRFVNDANDEGVNNLDLDYDGSYGYYELGSVDSLLDAFEKSGHISYRYSDSRQRTIEQELEDLTQEEIDKLNTQKKEVLSAIQKENLKLNEQIKNLQDSDATTTSEFNKLATDLAYDISDHLTEWQENPKEFYKAFPEKAEDDKDIRSMSRAELVEYVGINNLLNYIKEKRFGSTNDDIDIEKALLYYENFEALIRFGANTFNTMEDFNINYSEIGYKVEMNKEDNTTDALSNEEQSIAEECGDKQEHWQIDSRTIDNFLSMSQTVKRELARCYELDEAGNIIQNEFGINERVNPKDATSCILRWTQGALSLKDMITKLEEKSKNNPWVKTIISKLKDTSGKYSDFQSQFYGVFCKHFQNYYIVKEFKNDDGTKSLRIMPVNLNPALKEVLTSIEVMFKLQQHPLFSSKGINKEKYEALKTRIELLTTLSKEPFDTLDLDRIAAGIQQISGLLGYDTSHTIIKEALTEKTLKTLVDKANSIVYELSKNLDNSTYNPFTFNKKAGIRGYLGDFLTPLTDKLEDVALSAFYDNGKMYQSYIIPSFLTKLVKKFHNSDEKAFKEFMEKEYGQYDWFRDTSMELDTKSSWKSEWLKRLYYMSAEERAKLFDHKVQLSFNGHNYMRDMTGPEYVLSVITEYFSGTGDSKESMTTAWYKVPMMSNKPSLEFIKFIRYTGIGFETPLLKGYLNIFNQELQRISLVNERGYTEEDDEFISGFDSNGKKFCFLDFLNKFVGNNSTRLGELLTRKIKEDNLNNSEEKELQNEVKKQIEAELNTRANKIIQQYKDSGLFDVIKTIDGAGTTDVEVEANLREFVWNDTFAAMQILQMTITDIAYYKNAEDLQKRLAQIHAPGIRGNVNALDYGERDESGKLMREPKPVCDGKLRGVFLADYEGEAVKQNIIENLIIVFDRKVAESKGEEAKYWRELGDAIIKQFKKDVNVADAQAYNCPTSYRKKAIMFGKWSKEAEDLYQKIKQGRTVNLSDIQTTFQVIKPFVYTHVEKDSGVGPKLKVGMQFKNSEYLLIMADAILRNEDTGKPNLLRAIFNAMEKSAEIDNTKGIDTFMFASAVKAGLHGTIDIAEMTEEEAYNEIITKIGDSSKGYNQTYVHEYPAEDYTIQQEVPKHFMEHKQAHGSQERYIIPSDLALVDSNEKEVTYDYIDNGKLEKKNAKEFREEYENTIANSIEESIDLLYEELGLNLDPETKNIALSQVLQSEILSNSRYGMDLYFACSLNDKGEFNIPLGDPIQTKRIEQLINSIVKNRINKQKIAGGPVVQVSNFGMSKRLNIKFKDKTGGLLLTYKEWSKKNPGKSYAEYKDYITKNQGGVAHYECYAPAYMKEMLEDFLDENGDVDIEAIQEIAPEMLDMVGYRIPSEDAYSIAPLKIVGFLPKEAGEGIVMPYEITLITGSDRIVVSTSII